jgi:hypothetical protein
MRNGDRLRTRIRSAFNLFAVEHSAGKRWNVA